MDAIEEGPPRSWWNAIELLVSDHREVEELFIQFEETDADTEKTDIAAKICKALAVHAMIEEELFYPEARDIFNDQDDKQIDEAIREHFMIKKLVSDIKTLSAGLRLSTEVKILKKLVEHHVEEEETEMFPLLKIKGMELDTLGEKMAARKEELLKIL